MALTFRQTLRPIDIADRGELVMDAKYNYIIDSMKWRIALNTAGFVVWLAVSVALLRAS
jgi:hypothetical protein